MNRRTTTLIGATLLGFLITASHAAFAQGDSPQYDLVIRHGAVYDGTGAGAVIQDVAVEGDRIAALGDLSRATGRQEVDATGLAVRGKVRVVEREAANRPCSSLGTLNSVIALVIASVSSLALT